MIDAWPIIFIGWPAIIVSWLLMGFGIATRRPGPILAGSLLALPFLLYLFATPRFRYWAPVLVLLNFAAVLAIQRRHRWLPAALVAPFLGTTAWLAYVVFSQ